MIFNLLRWQCKTIELFPNMVKYSLNLCGNINLIGAALFRIKVFCGLNNVVGVIRNTKWSKFYANNEINSILYIVSDDFFFFWKNYYVCRYSRCIECCIYIVMLHAWSNFTAQKLKPECFHLVIANKLQTKNPPNAATRASHAMPFSICTRTANSKLMKLLCTQSEANGWKRERVRANEHIFRIYFSVK